MCSRHKNGRFLPRSDHFCNRISNSINCKLPSKCSGDSHDSYAKQCYAAWFWNKELSVTLTESNCGISSPLRRFIDVPKIVYFNIVPSVG
jgi:hypothetical protein